MYKKLITFFSLLLIVSTGLANNYVQRENVIVIIAHCNGGADKSSSISANINGHTLTVSFTDNIGQVEIKITNASDVVVDCVSMQTPTGYQIYIPLAGRYIVTFTFPDGDEYYGEFEITE